MKINWCFEVPGIHEIECLRFKLLLINLYNPHYLSFLGLGRIDSLGNIAPVFTDLEPAGPTFAQSPLRAVIAVTKSVISAVSPLSFRQAPDGDRLQQRRRPGVHGLGQRQGGAAGAHSGQGVGQGQEGRPGNGAQVSAATYLIE